MISGNLSLQHLYRRKRRYHHLNQQNYIDNLPDNDSSLESSHSSQITSSFVSNDIESDPSTNGSEIEDSENYLIPRSKEYFEAVFVTILSHAGLNLHAAEIVINLFNTTNNRFSSEPVTFPSIRHFWDRQAKENIIHVYVLCPRKHSHGPFSGLSKDQEYFDCEGDQFRVNMNKDDYFIHLPLRVQLEKFLPSIPCTAWQESKIDPYEPDDVSNADLARRIKSSESSCEKLTMTLHSDEVGCSGSSSIKILPIFISINELRRKERRKFFFLVVLYVGKKKPTVESFLTPICTEIRSLSTDPMEIDINGKRSRKVSCHLIALIADAPMRAYLRNVRQYNHVNGCDWCLIQATTANGARLYANSTRAELNELSRKKEDFFHYKAQREENQNQNHIQFNPRFKGITGVSPLLNLLDFDIVDGVSVEPMHCISLGVFRNFVIKGILGNNTSIFESGINLNRFMSSIAERLTSIKVPSESARIVRGMDEIRLWKSSEYDSFLSYFFFSSVRGLLKKSVINYISCLCRIYYLSHIGPVNQAIIDEMDNLVEEYQIGTATLFGTRFLSYNLHILSHLSKSLRNLGPSASVSSYPLEDHMGKLKHKVRRYSHIGPSLLRVFLNDLKFSELCEVKLKNWQLNHKEKRNFGLCEKNSEIKKIPLRSISDSMKNLIFESIENQLAPIGLVNNQISHYKSILKCGIRYSIAEYCQDKQRNDSIICVGEKFYRIKAIVGFREKTLFLCQLFTSKRVHLAFQGFSGYFSFSLDHIYEVTESDRRHFDCIDIDSDISKCIFIQSTTFFFKYSKDFIIKPFLKNI